MLKAKLMEKMVTKAIKIDNETMTMVLAEKESFKKAM